MEDVRERKMSQFREGSFGRFESHEEGIPVYWRTVRMPDFGGEVVEVDEGGEGDRLMPALEKYEKK